MFQLKGLKPKNKGQTNFYQCCDLTKKVYLMLIERTQQQGSLNGKHTIVISLYSSYSLHTCLLKSALNPALPAFSLNVQVPITFWWQIFGFWLIQSMKKAFQLFWSQIVRTNHTHYCQNKLITTRYRPPISGPHNLAHFFIPSTL